MSACARFAAYGFATTHDALRAEAALELAGLIVTPVPTPRGLGALCGLAMRVPIAETAAAEETLRGAEVEWTARIEFEDRVPRP